MQKYWEATQNMLILGLKGVLHLLIKKNSMFCAYLKDYQHIRLKKMHLILNWPRELKNGINLKVRP